MTAHDADEYRALRATIRERGTARVWIFVAGLAAWAALALAATAADAVPAATLIPLLLLAGMFEAVFALHTGVERVGRYIQVFHEGDGAGWERVAMAYGQAFRGSGPDPLFSAYFWTAGVLNLIPVAGREPFAIDSAIVAIVHALFALRVWRARAESARQRAVDLDRFTRLRDESAARVSSR